MKLHEIPIESLPKTAARTVSLLHTLGVHTYQDLIDYFPYRYEDYRPIVLLHNLSNYVHSDDGDQLNKSLISKGKITIRVAVDHFDSLRTRRGITIQKVRISDSSSSYILTLFNQPYLRQTFRVGTSIQLSGTVRLNQGEPFFNMEEYDECTEGDTALHTGRLVAIYPQKRGISSRTIREKIALVLGAYPDFIPQFLPEAIQKKFQLVASSFAYTQIHFPDNTDSIAQARQRKAFEEFFCAQLSCLLIKQEWQRDQVPFMMDVQSRRKPLALLIKKLPFILTRDQSQCLDQVLDDLQRPTPMNRLLQGDVGSGKTIIALLASYVMHLHGLQTLIMAPTDILAQQHYKHFCDIFALLHKENPKVSLYTRQSKHDTRSAHIIIGTHALIGKASEFKNVGLVVVDEQHKFGVAQRAALKDKGLVPHMLSMTATPIPRTVLLTLYGELDTSVIKEKPVGRLSIKTYPVPPQKRHDAYAWIEKEILTNTSQAFIVCPLIELSDAETLQDVKAATVEYERLSHDVFPHLKLGLIHGRMKKDEKDMVMHQFKESKLNILVSTSVVEVGIDIPRATVIVIEAAERFGMAQLHQLRGRVGRSDKQSYCLLFSESASVKILNRLRLFSKTHDGFALAEFDLKNRGGGNIFGTQQHGMSTFKVAQWTDTDMIKKTQIAAEEFIHKHSSLDSHPELKRQLDIYRIKAIAPN
ncbi:hypothetical protein A3D08_03490 [Candidatus Roizmanbacteria bacterium RIFCSPHIGHO2_02_FULL_43_11]|uniref:Probable DNA 3'-5' helicase RecG n=1 Tax=Candidatus Roizmanbacteria bacterium RIFCSPHIGHO2_02_FULL_43_11 TaxID=1802043 RepID=A0A1F7HK82_9BACT|nr:MAG: hypothetical protein A3D08_03490 [Candidatus Roizmanbacteria bacterium RIFCSPHIGHO2_02_FULL_43_11]